MAFSFGESLAIFEILAKVIKQVQGKNLISKYEIDCLCKTWTNEGDINTTEPFFITLKFSNNNGDISGYFCRNDEYEMVFDLFLKPTVFSKKYILNICERIGWRSILQVSYVLNLAGNDNQITLTLKEYNFHNKYRWPKETELWIYPEPNAFDGWLNELLG